MMASGNDSNRADAPRHRRGTLALLLLGTAAVAGFAGLAGGFHLSSRYWNAQGPAQMATAQCLTVHGAYREALRSGVASVSDALVVPTVDCVMTLDIYFPLISEEHQRLVARDMRRMSQSLPSQSQDPTLAAIYAKARKTAAKYADVHLDSSTQTDSG